MKICWPEAPATEFYSGAVAIKAAQLTCLKRLEPGAVYPSHPHDGPEECLVLDGEIIVGDVRMRKGDYQRAEPNSQHIEQRSETGALIYLSAPMSLLSFR